MGNILPKLFLTEQVASAALLVGGNHFSQPALIGEEKVSFVGAAVRVLTLSTQLQILKVSFVLKPNDFHRSDSYL